MPKSTRYYGTLKVLTLATMLLTGSLLEQATAEEWVQFRGPGSMGISDATGLPTTWSSTENVKWSTNLPDLSPVWCGLGGGQFFQGGCGG